MRERAAPLLTAMVLALVCFGFGPVGVVANDLPGPCDLHRDEGETVRHLMKRTIACAVERFGPVSGGAGRAICIASRESGLDPKASSATGMYLGLYQHAAEYWPYRYDVHTKDAWELPTSAKSGRSNSIVTIRMVVRAGSWNAAGWRRGDC